MIGEIMLAARAFLNRTLTQDQEEVLTALCGEAMRTWEGRLREGLTPEDCRGAFVPACAWTALAGLAPALEAGAPAPRSFTAGDLSVSMGGSGGDWNRAVYRLKDRAEELMAGYTRDDGFFFWEVAG
ncbi:MAG: hypothetical protein IKY34_01225 [Ruminiclostridium sp.]|nr:hypothetical protein [Ruminiclostridium sp.]